MSSAGPFEWAVFAVLVAGLLLVDIIYASRGAQARSRRAAWTWTAIWIGVALAFGAWVGVRFGAEAALTYLTAYSLEKSLSVDNLVVFALVFSQTGIPPALQRRALVWGVVGALVMRALLIGFGIYLLARFHWIVYPFGLLLLYAAVRMLKEQQRHPWVETTCALCTSWISRFIPIAPELHGERFIVKVDGKRYATPLLVAVAAIESADFVFAVDSIPAVFAITRDPFLVYTSNVFALLGLRSLYAVIGDLVSRFRYLRVGLAVLLVFVALKLMLSAVVHIPAGVSLAIIAAILAAAIAASRFLPNPPARKGSAAAACSHRGEIKVAEPTSHACAKCQASGDSWVQLRMCMSCGEVGCCDSSKNRHATAHFRETGHPIIRSIESGESWKWCYVDAKLID
jgi:tellurite resistance protein TerC